MYWGVYDNYTIRTLKPRGTKSLLIRALEPSYKKNGIPYEIYTLNAYTDVLELYFDDISEVFNRHLSNRFSLFDEDMANRLIKFIKNNEFDEINVHCSAGISRSSAIMICISRILNKKEIEDYIYKCDRFMPNKLVISVFDNLFNYEHKIIHSDFINTNEYIWKNIKETVNIIKKENGYYSIEIK